MLQTCNYDRMTDLPKDERMEQGNTICPDQNLARHKNEQIQGNVIDRS